MDELQQELIKAGAHEAAAPLVAVLTDIVGILGGDRLRAFRESKRARQEKNERETLEATARLMDLRKVKPDPKASPETVEEILDAAKDCGSEELREMFARLLAAVFDVSRCSRYRREFVQIVTQMEPLEAELLPRLNVPTELRPNRVEYFAQQLSRTQDEIDNAVVHFTSWA